jgi:hypothetical protein
MKPEFYDCVDCDMWEPISVILVESSFLGGIWWNLNSNIYTIRNEIEEENKIHHYYNGN